MSGGEDIQVAAAEGDADWVGDGRHDFHQLQRDAAVEFSKDRHVAGSEIHHGKQAMVLRYAAGIAGDPAGATGFGLLHQYATCVVDEQLVACGVR